MAGETIYAGPAKVYRDGQAFFPEGENGQVDFSVDQEVVPIASALHGKLRSQQGDCTGKITFTPFDHWGNLAKLYPAYLGATVEATTGVLAIGTKLASGASLKPTTIWVPGDARSYVACNTAIVKPSDLHLGVGKALFGSMEIACIGDPAKDIGTAGFLYAITESAASDPGGLMTVTDLAREKWTGNWGQTLENMEAEEEWTISCEVKVQDYKVQRLTRLIKLISASWMVKGRIVGPSHTVIDGAIGINGGRLLGSSFGAGTDLVLTSQLGRTITLYNCDAVGVGFQFGGSRLGTGETGFVSAATFTAGVADPLIEFADIPA